MYERVGWGLDIVYTRVGWGGVGAGYCVHEGGVGWGLDIVYVRVG